MYRGISDDYWFFSMYDYFWYSILTGASSTDIEVWLYTFINLKLLFFPDLIHLRFPSTAIVSVWSFPGQRKQNHNFGWNKSGFYMAIFFHKARPFYKFKVTQLQDQNGVTFCNNLALKCVKLIRQLLWPRTPPIQLWPRQGKTSLFFLFLMRNQTSDLN